MAKKVKKVIVYMDMTDFFYELGCAAGGNKAYGSIKEVLENEPCANECGIVKVKVEYVETVKPNAWESGTDNKTIEEWEDYEKSEQYYNHLKARKKHYEKLVKTYKKRIDNFSK